MLAFASAVLAATLALPADAAPALIQVQRAFNAQETGWRVERIQLDGEAATLHFLGGGEPFEATLTMQGDAEASGWQIACAAPGCDVVAPAVEALLARVRVPERKARSAAGNPTPPPARTPPPLPPVRPWSLTPLTVVAAALPLGLLLVTLLRRDPRD